jgi:long-chain fatty acid transport protein
MRTLSSRWSLLAMAALIVGPSAASATDGHFMHGVGAIHSAMGGSGIAGTPSLLGAFYVNPAGIGAFKGSRFELGFELFKPQRSVQGTAGSFTGTTESTSDFVPIPAFGWSKSFMNDEVVLGVGGLAIGGFGVDYPTDPTNPILAPRPNGFGQVYSNFSAMKIAPAVAWNVSPALRVGAAVNVDWAALGVNPLPVAAPAFDPGPDGTPGTADDRAYYSNAANPDGAFGAGFQLGLQYQLTNQVALGLAYTSPQWFQKFEWNVVFENPNLPSYNTPRTVAFQMDMPAIYGAGVTLSVSPQLTIAADAKYMDYGNTKGFKDSGFDQFGTVKGFGWESIWVAATGLEFRPTSTWALRAGYNFAQNPIPDALSMYNIPAPAVVQHHLTGGIGYDFSDGFGVDVAAYHAFENSITGAIVRPNGALPGTSVKNTMSENSIGISFHLSPRR